MLARRTELAQEILKLEEEFSTADLSCKEDYIKLVEKQADLGTELAKLTMAGLSADVRSAADRFLAEGRES